MMPFTVMLSFLFHAQKKAYGMGQLLCVCVNEMSCNFEGLEGQDKSTDSSELARLSIPVSVGTWQRGLLVLK